MVKKAKVILINPPTAREQFIGEDNYFPLGILSLATVLREKDYEVEVVDLNNEFYGKDLDDNSFKEGYRKKVKLLMEEYNPDVVGIGAIFSGAFKYTIVLSKELKKDFPDVPIVVGGNHASTFKGEILRKFSNIDYVIIGEGEHTFLELVEKLKNQDHTSVSEISGICYRIENEVVVNEKGGYINNLDELPLGNYDILGVEKYNMNTKGWYNPHNIEIQQPFSIVSSRSCPLRCTFCNMWHVHGPSIRYRGAMNVVDEIESLYDKYDARYFQFMDDNFTFDKDRVINIMNEIVKRKLKISFDTPNGVAINRLDAAVIGAMVSAGLIRVSIAIESGSEKIRKLMKKGLTQKAIYTITNEIAEYSHVFINAFFIIGMPEESKETLEETRHLIKSLPLDKFALSYATPFPGTALFNELKERGLLEYDEADFVDLTHLQARADVPHFTPPNISVEELVEFRKWGQDYLSEKFEKSGKAANAPYRFNGQVDLSKAHKAMEDYLVERDSKKATPLLAKGREEQIKEATLTV